MLRRGANTLLVKHKLIVQDLNPNDKMIGRQTCCEWTSISVRFKLSPLTCVSLFLLSVLPEGPVEKKISLLMPEMFVAGSARASVSVLGQLH